MNSPITHFRRKRTKPKESVLSTYAFLALFGFGLIAISVVLWKTEESRNLTQIRINTEAAARSHSSETTIRYDSIYKALSRLASRGAPADEVTSDDWGKDAAFYIDAFMGIHNVAWVDKAYRVRQTVPPQDNALYVDQVASNVVGDPLDINLWIPSYAGERFRGYILGIVDVVEFMEPVVSETADHYMFELSNEGTIIFRSENWEDPREEFTVSKITRLENTATLNLTFAPTDEFIASGTASASKTLLFSLSFSLIAIVAVFFAQRYSVLANQNRLRYRNTLESMIGGCQIIGFDWRYLFINDAAAKQIQRRKEDLLGRTMMECTVNVEETELFAMLRRCMDERVHQEKLDSVTFPDGSVGWYELSIQPAPDGILILSSDVTIKRRAELEIIALNAELEQRVADRTAQLEASNKELEAFAYSVSHDLRAPLSHIHGFAQVLDKRIGSTLDEKSQHQLANILDAAKRMSALIDDLLLFSRMGRVEMLKAEVDLERLVDQILVELRPETQDRDIVWQISELGTVYGDLSLLHQVMYNLLANAVKFTGKQERAHIEISRETQDDAAVICVRDNGVGFDMKYVDKLFGVFQRLHSRKDFEGTGIGLANVQLVIHRHGGRVWAEGSPDAGAAFYFSLPNLRRPNVI